MLHILKSFEFEKIRLEKRLSFLSMEIREYSKHPCDTVDLLQIQYQYDSNIRQLKNCITNINHYTSALKRQEKQLFINQFLKETI
jgi:transcriptional regulator with AAA-type ATPase domain